MLFAPSASAVPVTATTLSHINHGSVFVPEKSPEEIARLKAEHQAWVLREEKAALAAQEVARQALAAQQAQQAVEAARQAEAARIASVWAAHPRGNDMYFGECVFYVSNKVGAPVGLGNADTWFIRAQAWGFPTGSVPRVGAVGQRGMHVVYVEAVNPDGSVLISEMNYVGWNVVDYRTTPGDYWNYIYFN